MHEVSRFDSTNRLTGDCLLSYLATSGASWIFAVPKCRGKVQRVPARDCALQVLWGVLPLPLDLNDIHVNSRLPFR